jgi:hypothetical protein
MVRVRGNRSRNMLGEAVCGPSAPAARPLPTLPTLWGGLLSPSTGWRGTARSAREWMRPRDPALRASQFVSSKAGVRSPWRLTPLRCAELPLSANGEGRANPLPWLFSPSPLERGPGGGAPAGAGPPPVPLARAGPLPRAVGSPGKPGSRGGSRRRGCGSSPFSVYGEGWQAPQGAEPVLSLSKEEGVAGRSQPWQPRLAALRAGPVQWQHTARAGLAPGTPLSWSGMP